MLESVLYDPEITGSADVTPQFIPRLFLFLFRNILSFHPQWNIYLIALLKMNVGNVIIITGDQYYKASCQKQ